MHKHKKDGQGKTVSGLERYLAKEIGVEFKACLYFFCILFFYSVYRMVRGSFEASIVHMGEMILLTYTMGYVQLYLLANFDEGEGLKGKEVRNILLCTGIYTVVSFWGRWFDRGLFATVCFALYMVFAYICAFLVYKIKREIDGKLLNEDLKAFQERRKQDGERDRDS